MTEALKSLFDASHHIDRSVVQSLDQDDLSALRSFVRGTRPAVDRVRALEALGMRHVPDFVDLTRSVLVRPLEDLGLRASAATLLARWGGHAAEPILIEALRQPQNPVIAIKLLAAIARIGTAPSLDAVARVRNSSDDALRRQAEFAALVIGHRLGLAESAHAAPPPSALAATPPGPLQTFTLHTATDGDYRDAVRHLAPADAFGIPLTTEAAFAIRCGRATSLLLLDRKCLADIAKAWRRPLLLGVLAERADVDGSYSVARTLLAGPLKENELYIALHRLDGIEVHFGTGHVENDRVRFTVQSLSSIGTPFIDVRGVASRGSIVLEAALTHAPAASTRQPTRIRIDQ